MKQIVFEKEGKVVCYLCGHTENTKFGISFVGIDYKDSTIFDVTKNKDTVCLKHR